MLPVGEREKNIAADLKDVSWFDEIDATGGVVFFASGVFYYFLTEDVKTLFLEMAEHFSQGCIVFDTCGKTGAKMISKTWLKEANIKDVDAYFSVGDAQKEIAPSGCTLVCDNDGVYDGKNSPNKNGGVSKCT